MKMLNTPLINQLLSQNTKIYVYCQTSVEALMIANHIPVTNINALDWDCYAEIRIHYNTDYLVCTFVFDKADDVICIAFDDIFIEQEKKENICIKPTNEQIIQFLAQNTAIVAIRNIEDAEKLAPISIAFDIERDADFMARQLAYKPRLAIRFDGKGQGWDNICWDDLDFYAKYHPNVPQYTIEQLVEQVEKSVLTDMRNITRVENQVQPIENSSQFYILTNCIIPRDGLISVQKCMHNSERYYATYTNNVEYILSLSDFIQLSTILKEGE